MIENNLPATSQRRASPSLAVRQREQYRSTGFYNSHSRARNMPSLILKPQSDPPAAAQIRPTLNRSSLRTFAARTRRFLNPHSA